MLRFLASVLFLVSVNSQGVQLRDAISRSGRYFGAAVNWNQLERDSQYEPIHSAQFNMLSAEYEMKMAFMNPQDGVFDYSIVDQFVDYAERTNMQVRGHAFVWHESMPGWLEYGQWTNEQVLQKQKDWIWNVGRRYSGRIYAWDVVNEALNDQDGGLRDTFWLQRLGYGYIDDAFWQARASDPEAKLFYNDYWVEEAGHFKGDAMYNLVRGLKERGVPIDGVGMQCHLTLYGLNFDAFRNNLYRYQDLGLDIHLTELDIRIDQTDGSVEHRLSVQNDMYWNIVRICLEVERCRVIQTWGFTDRYTWLGDAALPLLYDHNYNPKGAFWATYDSILEHNEEKNNTNWEIQKNWRDGRGAKYFDGESFD